jgi:single-strand DNA-binding protein
MHEGLTIIHGNLVGNPRVNRLPSGDDVTNFRVASSSRRQDRASGEWVDTDPFFVDVTCWRTVATNAAASLRKGDAVVVAGQLRTKEFTVGDQKRREPELDARFVGASLARSAVRFLRTQPAVMPGRDDVEPGAVAAPGAGDRADSGDAEDAAVAVA